jgi:uncharacterized BrkB/YihY/UPF0761 family membrane protein
MKTVWEIFNQTLRQWQQDGALGLAAALSFYAVISLAPVVTMSLSVASIFYGEEASVAARRCRHIFERTGILRDISSVLTESESRHGVT